MGSMTISTRTSVVLNICLLYENKLPLDGVRRLLIHLSLVGRGLDGVGRLLIHLLSLVGRGLDGVGRL